MTTDNVIVSLPKTIVSEDGLEYVIDVWRPSNRMLQDTWDEYKKYRVLFSDIVVNDFKYFFSMVMAKDTIVLQVTQGGVEVGLLYGTEIRPGRSALAHYVFWKGRQAGKQRVILYTLALMMEELGLHRINITIPMYAHAALHRVHKMGLRIEGRRREAILYNGRWSDMLEFGVCIDELTDEAIEASTLPRTDDQQHWHGLLKQDELLARKVLRVKNGNGS